MLYHTLYNKIHIFFVVVVSSRHTLTFSKKKKIYIYIYINIYKTHSPFVIIHSKF